MMRELAFVGLLVVAAGLVVAGVGAVSGPAAMVVAGGLLAGLTFLAFADDGKE